MNNRARGPSPGGRAAGSARLPYDTIRDRFLGELPPEEQQLDFYVRIGMYVWSRWEAIASDDPHGEIVNEDSSPRWDECTEREYEGIREAAANLITIETARRKITGIVEWSKAWVPASKTLGWIGMRIFEALVTAVALIFWAWLFIHLAPHLQAAAKAALNS